MAAWVFVIVFGSDHATPAASADPPGAALACLSGEPHGVAEADTSGLWTDAMPFVHAATVDPPEVTAAVLPGAEVVEPPESACPDEMVRVSGEYCTEVKHRCKQWLDDPKLPYARCGEYEPVARCVGQRIAMNFCIDRLEYTAPGEKLPLNFQSFVTGSKVCRQQGKRLCTEREWNFACEGEQMRPYPYGWKRAAKCNQDRDDLYEMKRTKRGRKQVLRDHRAPASSYSDCVSPFGVQNMVGNLDEPVLREVAKYNPPYRNGLKGGWWMAGRNRCRPATTAHDDYYRDIQVGVRCCTDLPGLTGASG
jgi:sulfatase modifying factor 1